jgi:L-asparaginase
MHSHQNFDWRLIQEAINNGAEGIVIAGTGAGSLSDLTIIEVERLLKLGFPIVASTKMSVEFASR